MSDRVKILVGTRKGAFVYTSDRSRERWELSGLLMGGWSVYHMAADLRANPPRLYAATNHAVWGPSVAKSTDLGKTWEQRSEGLDFLSHGHQSLCWSNHGQRRSSEAPTHGSPSEVRLRGRLAACSRGCSSSLVISSSDQTCGLRGKR